MTHPYRGLPDQQFWRKDKGISDGSQLDPVSDPPFRIAPDERIVTAGSCFAQHVATYMSEAGFNHLITEQAHPLVPAALAKQFNYGMFSARYGNIYTARQLRQLFERAYGTFTPLDVSWCAPKGHGVVDPFRPQIQPEGYLSQRELEADRAFHFRCIREAVENMDVFVFTLGLTEAWADTRDGAVFPLAPGVAGGTYDPDRVQFVNFDENETYEDLRAALDFIRGKRPDVRIVLTVSPVPLNATYENRHVLVSTAWSKAVLRIVAERAAREVPDCVYFPSFEIITSPHVRGQYFGADCREVTRDGVNHVMRLFLRHFTKAAGNDAGLALPDKATDQAARHHAEMEKKIEALCDEEAIGND